MICGFIQNAGRFMEFIHTLGTSKNTCAAFTGYRPQKMKLPSNIDPEKYVRKLVRPAIVELYGKGIRIFMSGMAEGFDLWAAAEVLSLRDAGVCPDAEVVAVIPFVGQPAKFSVQTKELYDYISINALHRVVISQNYYPECFYQRNDYLVDNASTVIAFYDGQSGGTRYTVRRASKLGIPVINICARELELF